MSETCVICMEVGDPSDTKGNRLMRLCMSECECNGFIHKDCLQQWVLRNPTLHSSKCPICRTNGENFTLLECTPDSVQRSIDNRIVSIAIDIPSENYSRIVNEPPPRNDVSRIRNYSLNYIAFFGIVAIIILYFIIINIS
jgi:hypothetical protein